VLLCDCDHIDVSFEKILVGVEVKNDGIIPVKELFLKSKVNLWCLGVSVTTIKFSNPIGSFVGEEGQSWFVRCDTGVFQSDSVTGCCCCQATECVEPSAVIGTSCGFDLDRSKVDLNIRHVCWVQEC
jgi:hypothetical protein